MLDVERPYFMENDAWWFTDDAGQARVAADAPMEAKKSYWKWIGSEPMPSDNVVRCKNLMYFKYEAWSMHPEAVVFERSGGDVFVSLSRCFQDESFAGCSDDMLQLEGLIDRHGLLGWPRVSRRPEDICICDGVRWTIEFVFADGVMHRRRGETCGEPETYREFMDELDAFLEHVISGR